MIRSEHLHKSCPPLATARGSLATGWLLAAREVVGQHRLYARKNLLAVIKKRKVVVHNREVVVQKRNLVEKNPIGVRQHQLDARNKRLAVENTIETM